MAVSIGFPSSKETMPIVPDPENLIIRSATNSDCGEIRDLVFSVLREYGLKPDPEGLDRDLVDIESSYIGRGGTFEVIEDGQGTILGTVGLFPVDRETIELRKMYFRPELRGMGMGKSTLRRSIEAARRLGYERITLETASVLKEAIGLYTSFGFRDLEGSHADRCDRSFYLDL